MNKLEKKQYIENLDKMSKEYSALFVTSFTKMSVKDMINFRTEIRNNDGITKVSKNNIVKIFLDKDEERKPMSEFLSQQKLLIFTNNPVGTAKVCKQFEKDLKKSIEDKISLNPILNSFQKTIHNYQIDYELIDSFLNSMKLDLDKKKYLTKKEFDQYVYGSADVVGLMCLKVFVKGNKNQYDNLRPYAMSLGSAFQRSTF